MFFSALRALRCCAMLQRAEASQTSTLQAYACAREGSHSATAPDSATPFLHRRVPPPAAALSAPSLDVVAWSAHIHLYFLLRRPSLDAACILQAGLLVFLVTFAAMPRCLHLRVAGAAACLRLSSDTCLLFLCGFLWHACWRSYASAGMQTSETVRATLLLFLKIVAVGVHTLAPPFHGACSCWSDLAGQRHAHLTSGWRYCGPQTASLVGVAVGFSGMGP